MRLPTFAQTNLQLYAQMKDLNFQEEALILVHEAYLFAARLACGVLRGSGKPFVCHLVGTASILAAAGEDEACIAAGLLHAIYQDRVAFPGNRYGAERRDYVREKFGLAVETLVYQYHLFELLELASFGDEQLRESQTVVKIRLADELEDMLDSGIAMHGKLGDDASVRGSAESRRVQKAVLADQLLRAARIVGNSMMIEALQYWLQQSLQQPWPATLRTNAYSSFQVGMADV